MAQGKTKNKQARPGDSLKKAGARGGSKPSGNRTKGVNKKKTEPRGGAKHNTSATTSMKRDFQKAINARIEQEVGQRVRSLESKSFTLLKPGGESSTTPGLSVKATLKETTKRMQRKKSGKKN